MESSTSPVTRPLNRGTRPVSTFSTVKKIAPTKSIRKTLRRKIKINSSSTTSVSTATTTEAYEKTNEGIDDALARVLPAITSVRPRKPSRPFPPTITSTSTQSWVLQPQLIQLENKQTKPPIDANAFDKILEHQYKIKGIDISSEETFEDEKLIGVQGSQVIMKFWLKINKFH